MKAIEINRPGGTPALVERPDPVAGAGEVVVDVRACALNFADLLMIRGEYQERAPFPLTPGMELAGQVLSVGDGVDRGWIGRRVAAFTRDGGLAERVALRADRLVTLDATLDFDTAAAMPVAYGTSHLSLSRVARLTAGETLLVLGAAGGVGLTAVELGKLMGARVIASARGPQKGAIAAAAGADAVIDSDTDDLVSTVRNLGGADVVYDPVGGEGFAQALRVTRPEGRILLIGFAGGSLPDIRPNHLLVKNVSVHGFYWGGYLAFLPSALTESLSTIFRWQAEGRIQPHISHRLPLERATEGLELLRTRASTGKVIVTP